MKKTFVFLFLGLLAVGCNSCATTPAVLPKPEAPQVPWQYFFGSSASPSSDDPVVKEAQSRAVVIATAEGACSGGIESTGTVLTAGHCFPQGEAKNIFVNGIQATVLKNDPLADVLILHIYTDEVKALETAEPKVDMEIFAVSTQHQYRNVVKHGRITHVEDDTFTTDLLLIPGASGCLVYSKEGKLIGILNLLDAGMTKGVKSRKIKEVEGGQGEMPPLPFAFGLWHALHPHVD